MSAITFAPTFVAISPIRSKSIVRGYADAPQISSFGRLSSANLLKLVVVDLLGLASLLRNRRLYN